MMDYFMKTLNLLLLAHFQISGSSVELITTVLLSEGTSLTLHLSYVDRTCASLFKLSKLLSFKCPVLRKSANLALDEKQHIIWFTIPFQDEPYFRAIVGHTSGTLGIG